VLAGASRESDFELAFATFAEGGRAAARQRSLPRILARKAGWARDQVRLAGDLVSPRIPSSRRPAQLRGANFEAGYRQAAVYAGRILAGAKPADLPVMQPNKFELGFNLKTAKAIGLAASEAFLLRADEVID